jgi:hypothetical protein
MGEYKGNGRTLANPVKFTINEQGPDCYGSGNSRGSGDDTNTFLGATGRIADIEALNNSTKGLELLNKTAAAGGPNATRLINGGVDSVLDTVLSPAGIGAQDVYGPINRVSPSATNKAIFSAGEISDKLKDGDFSSSDIPLYTRDFANVMKISARIITPSETQKFEPKCSAPPYAMDMMRFGVKQNYRFMATFEFNEPYSQTLGNLTHAFGLKTCDRPQVNVEYEDINMYNYRTKVPLRTVYNPISMEFYDDQWSQALDFYNMYLQTVSPIANMEEQEQMFEEWGMNFGNQYNSKAIGGASGDAHATHNYSGSFGPNDPSFGPGSINIIRKITIYHLYRGGGILDRYQIYNPKITEMGLDQLSMEGGSTGIVNMQFAYDSVYIDTFWESDVFKEEILEASSGSGRNSAALFQVATEPLPEGAVNTPNGKLIEQEATVASEQDKGILDTVQTGLQSASDFFTGL